MLLAYLLGKLTSKLCFYDDLVRNRMCVEAAESNSFKLHGLES